MTPPYFRRWVGGDARRSGESDGPCSIGHHASGRQRTQAATASASKVTTRGPTALRAYPLGESNPCSALDSYSAPRAAVCSLPSVLLPFCSRDIPKHPVIGLRTTHQQTTWNCSQHHAFSRDRRVTVMAVSHS